MISPEPTKRNRFFRTIGLARPQWVRLTWGTLFLFLGSAMSLAYPQAIRIIIDQALGEGGRAVIDQAAMVMLALFAVQGLSVAVRYYLFTVAGERVVAQLRTDLFTRIMAQEIGFFDSRRTGELTNRLASDTAVLQNTVSVNISMALRGAATVIGATALLFYTSGRLTLLMLLVVPPIAIGAAVAGRLVRRLSKHVQDALARAGEVAEETISGIRTVRSFAQEEREVKRYDAEVMRSFDFSRRRVIAVGWFQGVASFAGFSALALVLWYGGHLVLDGKMSVGELTAFLLYTLSVAMSLAMLAGLWADFMRAVGASDRVFDLMDRLPHIPTRGGTRLDAMEGSLHFQGVSFTYPARDDVEVLHDVNLEIAPGERVALVGPSGGGKSTLASLVPRFYDPNEGAVLVDGQDLRELDPHWLRRRIGVVAQEPILFSTSIEANINYGRSTATREEIEAAATAANAADFIEQFPDGYATEVGERGVQLSGGQKQRVAIARAVLRDPRILILDEATSALDSESEHLVKEALERLITDAVRTTIVIAHRLSTVINADRVVVIDGGRVVQIGTHHELMEQQDGPYRRLVERQLMEG